MLRAATTFLAALLLASPAPSAALQRAITNTGEIIPDRNAPLEFSRYDFSDVEISAELLQLVNRLGSEDFAEREEATQALLEREFDREQIYAVLSQQELTAEQRHRLLGVVIDHLAGTPRGAVGISMRWDGMRGQPGAVVVQQLIPGFDAARVLKLNDRITHVNGNVLFDSNDFGRLVQSMSPGEEAQFTVERQHRNEKGEIITETLELTITLGSLQVLKEGPGGLNVVQPIGDVISSEIRWAQSRFGAPTRTIKVKGGMPALSIQRDAPPSIDSHPVIAELRQQIADFENGEIENLDMLRVQWGNKLESLLAAARHDVNEDMREERMSVLIRFRELIAPYKVPR